MQCTWKFLGQQEMYLTPAHVLLPKRSRKCPGNLCKTFPGHFLKHTLSGNSVFDPVVMFAFAYPCFYFIISCNASFYFLSLCIPPVSHHWHSTHNTFCSFVRMVLYNCVHANSFSSDIICRFKCTSCLASYISMGNYESCVHKDITFALQT